MNIEIQSLSFHASDKLTDFTHDKVSKLTQFTDQIMRADVILKIDKSDTRENKICEIKLSIPGNDLFVVKQNETFEGAVLEAVDSIKQQVVRWKEKIQDRTNLPDPMSVD